MNPAAVLTSVLASAVLAAGCAGPGLFGGDPTVATVARVVDGDTVELDNGDTIRVLALDTPETVAPGRPVECWGPQASAWAHTTLAGRQVRVVPDPSQDQRDRYQRRLAYLILPGGVNYSVLAAEQGMGRAYAYRPRNPPRAYAQIAAAEQRARNAHLGLWGSCPT